MSLYYILSIRGCLGQSYFLVNMSDAAMNIHIRVFMWAYVFIFLGYVPGNRMVTISLLLRNVLLTGRKVDEGIVGELYH